MKYFFCSLLCALCLWTGAQDWNGKRCAVVLTYDDALDVHLDLVLPALDSVQLKGTFFLTASSPAFTQRLDQWRKAAANRHELANHTLFHPCNGRLPGRGFVTADYDLATYTLRRITDEIRLTNSMLQAVDGQPQHTFAYPCGDTRIGDSAYINGVKGALLAARGVQGVLVPRKNVDLYNVGSFMIHQQTGAELIAMVKKAQEANSMIVFLFHGVGGGHALNVSLEAHRQLLQFLKAQEKDIWTTTFREAAQYIRSSGAAQ